MNKEIRLNNVELRMSETDEMPVIRGYALKFDKRSEVLGYFTPFVEVLKRGCLDQADMTSVVALVNHDANMPLARSGVNLKLTVDDVGLYFEFQPTDTSYARDLVKNMQSGVVSKCSFAFTISDEERSEEWQKDGDVNLRYINKIDKIYDVSVVTTPAYEDTEAVVSARSKELAEKINKKDDSEEREKIAIEIQSYI